jgi:hypothetical protein
MLAAGARAKPPVERRVNRPLSARFIIANASHAVKQIPFTFPQSRRARKSADVRVLDVGELILPYIAAP